MKKLIMTFAVLALAVGISMAQNGPVMTFEKTEIDYGNVTQGSDGVRIFKFKNTGKEALIITNARGSCGCTIPKWSSEPIKPGQTGTIEVKYDTNRLGSFTKSVTVESNAGVAALVIKGNVYEKQFEKNVPQGSSSNKR